MKKIWNEHKARIIKIIISIFLLVEAIVLRHYEMGVASIVCFVASYVIIVYEIFFEAIICLFKEHELSETFLMTIASAGAMIIGEYFEAIAIIVLYLIGEMFEDIATDKSKRSIEKLIEIRPDKARNRSGEKKPVSEFNVGDEIEVLAGERIPLDSDVVEGTAHIDSSVITGESEAVKVWPGNEVLAGCMNLDSPLILKVKRPSSSSAAQRIIELSEKSLESKAKSEKFIRVFAKIYTPIVILLAILLAVLPPLMTDKVFTPWVYKALSLLAISCPCAFVISIPLSYYCGIGRASRKGILIKSPVVVDNLAKVRTIAFDKTGTLTKPNIHVNKIDAVNSVGKATLLKYISIAECKSNHPIAKAVLREAEKFNIEYSEGTNYKETVGYGVECDSEYGHIKVGSIEFVKSAPPDSNGTIMVSIDELYVGCITIGDEIKNDSRIAFESLKKLKVDKKIILSGDKRSKVEMVAKGVFADGFFANLTPEEKLDIIEKLIQETKGKVAYCGDGINDAPSIARADVGISMGSIGSDSAVEISDVVIMDDNVSNIPLAIKIAKRTKRTVIGNIVLSIIIKAAMLTLCSLGFIPMIGAVLADVGLLILTIILSLFAGK